MPSKKPNLFIVGMPRAGTTTLHNNLHQHTEIFMSDEKEPHFFGSDLTRYKTLQQTTKKEYLDLFSTAKNEKIIGESSTGYIFSQKAAKEIFEFNPKSKIIITLRDPVDNIFSLFKKNYNPKNFSFEEVLMLEDEGKEDYIKNDVWTKETYLLKENIHNLPENIKRYQEIFGNENVEIIFFEDLINNKVQVLHGIQSFLGIKDIIPLDYTAYNNDDIKNNASTEPKLVFLNNFIYRNSGKNGFLGKIRRSLFKESPNFIKNLKKLNIKPSTENIKINPITRKKLCQEFIPAIEKIEKITQKDLSSWKV